MGGNIAHLVDGREHNFDEGKDFFFDNKSFFIVLILFCERKAFSPLPLLFGVL